MFTCLIWQWFKINFWVRTYVWTFLKEFLEMGTFQINIKVFTQGGATCCKFTHHTHTHTLADKPHREKQDWFYDSEYLNSCFPVRWRPPALHVCSFYNDSELSRIWLTTKMSLVFTLTSFSEKCSFKALQSWHIKHKCKLILFGTMPLKIVAVYTVILLK